MTKKARKLGVEGLGKLSGLVSRRVVGALALLTVSAPVLAKAPIADVATVRTGDRIDGIDVIDALNVDDLARGNIYRFWFRVTDNSIGQAWYVPSSLCVAPRRGHGFC